MKSAIRFWWFTVLAVACASNSSAATPSEPVYQSKPLGWWLAWWSTNREGPWVSADGPLFRTPDVSQCESAFSAMGPAAFPFVMQCLRDNASPRLNPRHAAIYFGYIGSNAIPQLVDAMKDPLPVVRCAAALALLPYAGNFLSTNDAVRIFSPALEDSDDEVVATSLEALAGLGPAAFNSVPALIRILQVSLIDTNKSRDWNHRVQCNAAQILASIGPPAASAMPVLTNLLASAGFTDDLSLAIAIWRVSSNTTLTLPVLLKYGEFGYVGAIDALGEMGSSAKAAVPFLLRRSRSADSIQRRSAARALQRIDRDAAAAVGIR